jgi:DNA-binding winged helix-turn-helix (wHTH) protein/Tol biopolymer transport system component
MDHVNPMTRMIRFGLFELDANRGELRRQGVRIKLAGQAFRLLEVLLEKPGELVTRDQLRLSLWSTDTFVDFDHSLNATVNRVREVLGDSADNPIFIETVPRRGYRFIAPVNRRERQSPSEVVILQPGAGEMSRRYWSRAIGGSSVLLLIFAVTFWFTKRSVLPLPVAEMHLNQLTSNASDNPVRSGNISHDGRYLAYSDLEGIHIKLIETGEMRVASAADSPKDSRLEWNVAAWFPDSTSFLANLHRSDKQPPSVWAFSVLGGRAPREVRADAEAWSISPDGSTVAFGKRTLPDENSELWLMDSNGEHERKLFALEGNTIQSAQFSPDGQQLVYRRSSEGPENTLEIRDLKGGPPTKIFSSTRLRDHWWLPDGRLIFGLTEEINPDNCNYWTLPLDVRTGKPSGKPYRLTNWAGFSLNQTSATADGKRLVFLASAEHADSYVAEVNKNSRGISNPSPLAREGYNAPVSWTADSKEIIIESFPNGHAGIFRQSFDSGIIEPIVNNQSENAMGARVSPDGAWILYLSVPNLGAAPPLRLMRVPVGGGSSRFVLQPQTYAFSCARSPATICAISEWTPDRKQLIFTAFEALKGRGDELGRIDTDPEADYDWALSPDASRVVIRKNREARLSILDFSRHESRQITIKGWSTTENLDWAPDGKGLFTSGLLQRGAVLLYVDLNGSPRPIWEEKGADFTWAVPSPDGGHLAIGSSSHRNNLWIMENF